MKTPAFFSKLCYRNHMAWVLLIVFSTACSKSVNEPDVLPAVSFAITVVDDNTPEQGKTMPATAEIRIGNDTPFQVPVLRSGDMFYTYPVAMDYNFYQITRFLLLDGDGNVVYAVPEKNSEFAQKVKQPVDFMFTYSSEDNRLIEVEVIPFHEPVYEKFGFEWFVTEHNACFFGDICLDGNPFYTTDLAGSMYQYAPGGLKIDMAAIFRIKVFFNGEETEGSPYSNEEWFGVGKTVCIPYSAMPYSSHQYSFELWLLAPDKESNGFTYQHYHTFEAAKNGSLLPDNSHRKVIDFVVGNCVYNDTALRLKWK